jgi:hypothetical protein
MGAEQAAAAVCDARGTVLAVMPHPERAADLGALSPGIAGAWADARSAALARGAIDSPGPGLRCSRVAAASDGGGMNRKRARGAGVDRAHHRGSEAISAGTVARGPSRRGPVAGLLRRLRLFELSGPLPARGPLEKLLHRSIQFYNPIQERCTVRRSAGDAAPVRSGEHAVLVFERGEERRGGAERWWRH